MEAVLLMLAVTACYTISALSDKYAVAEAKFSGDEFTFIMCSSMTAFLTITLPFQELTFTLRWQSFAALALISGCKLLEFQSSARVLRQLSAVELKAWIGLTLIASYITDIIFGVQLDYLKFVCIFVTIIGLALIARSGRDGQVDYKSIILPLALYLLSKFGYGLLIKAFTPYVSPTVQIFSAMLILALIMLPKISVKGLLQKNKGGVIKVVLARIPNTVGMLLENAVIAISLANYSFIQPMILVTLFVIGFLRKEKRSPLNLVGSIVCVAGVIAFQLL